MLFSANILHLGPVEKIVLGKMSNLDGEFIPELNKKYPESYNIGQKDEKRKIKINCTAYNHYPEADVKILYSESENVPHIQKLNILQLILQILGCLERE